MQKLANQDYKDGFTTELPKTQQHLINYINDLQPVCRKVIEIKIDSVSKSTINKHIRKLLDKEMLKKVNVTSSKTALKLTELG